jgi:hypothetical protein
MPFLASPAQDATRTRTGLTWPVRDSRRAYTQGSEATEEERMARQPRTGATPEEAVADLHEAVQMVLDEALDADLIVETSPHAA